MTGAFSTVLAEDEILVGLRIPKFSAGARWGYYKFSRKPGEFAEAIGIHALFGAFLMGAIMPKGSQFVRHLSEKLEDYTVVFLLPIFFAFAGWWEVTRIAGEVENAERNIPRTLVIGILIITTVYVLTSAVFFYLVHPSRVTNDPVLPSRPMNDAAPRAAVPGGRFSATSWTAPAVELAATISASGSLSAKNLRHWAEATGKETTRFTSASVISCASESMISSPRRLFWGQPVFVAPVTWDPDRDLYFEGDSVDVKEWTD